ncbi:MAG: sugar transferase [Caldilineaceae bacterium]|nr:sugar transferase [Caldilineaceae bacterium]
MVASDALMVAAAFGLAYWLRFYGGVTLVDDVPAEPQKYLRLILILIPVWLALFWLLHLYDYHTLLGGTGEYTRALNGCTAGMMLVVVVSFFVPDFAIARGWLVMAWVFSCVMVGTGRFVLRRVAYRLRRYGYFVERTLVVGTNDEAVALAAQLQDSRSSGLSLVGFVDGRFVDGHFDDDFDDHSVNDSPTDSTWATDTHTLWQNHPAALPILGDLASLPALIRAHQIEEVVIATTALERRQRLQTLEYLLTLPGVEMRLSSGLYEIFTTGMQVTTKNSVPLMTPNRLRLDRLESFLKRTVDCTTIALALPFLLPMFALIGLCIKTDSAGPVFYRRRVLGIGGRAFGALKFRTMVQNGDEVLAARPDLAEELRTNHKLREDPRVTRVGQFLRRTSLDELPQLINVLLGQMSLVGPRMISPEEAEMYGTMYLNLLTVKPGLTGLWQVSGRSDLSYGERVRLDMHYIRNYSIWWDLQILFVQTLPAVLGRKGAY